MYLQGGRASVNHDSGVYMTVLHTIMSFVASVGCTYGVSVVFQLCGGELISYMWCSILDRHAQSCIVNLTSLIFMRSMRITELDFVKSTEPYSSCGYVRPQRFYARVVIDLSSKHMISDQ